MLKFVRGHVMLKKKIRKIVNSSFATISAEMLGALYAMDSSTGDP